MDTSFKSMQSDTFQNNPLNTAAVISDEDGRIKQASQILHSVFGF